MKNYNNLYKITKNKFRRYRLGNPGEFWGMEAKDYFFLYTSRTELNMHINLENRKVCVYDRGVPVHYFEEIMDFFGIRHCFTLDIKNDWVIDIDPEEKDDDYYYNWREPETYALYYGWGSWEQGRVWRWTSPNGARHEEVSTNYIHKIDNRVLWMEESRPNAYLPWWVSQYTRYKMEFLDGEEYYIKNFHSWWGWILAKEVEIAGRKFWKGYDIIGNPTKNDPRIWGPESWKTNRNYINIFIVDYIDHEDIPDNFRWDKAYAHFFGRVLDLPILKEYLRDYPCNCNRCKGIDVIKEDFDTYWMSWRRLFLIRFAGEHGKEFQSWKDLYDCDCSFCKKLRRQGTWRRIATKSQRKELRKNLGGEVADYYTTISHTECLLFYPPDEFPLTEKDVNTKYHRFPSGVIQHRVKSSITSYWGTDVDLFIKIHCLLNDMTYEQYNNELQRYRKECFTTLCNPDCDCYACEFLNTEGKIRPAVFYDLVIENIDARSYPCGIFLEHFKPYQVSKHMEAYRDYFNKYILTGKFCDCDKCRAFLEKIKNQEHLPSKELAAPKCPRCGNKVHRADLIYDNVEIAKAIKKQGFDKSVKVRTALCCSCYGEEIAKYRYLNFIAKELKPGRVVEYNGGERAILKQESDGTRTVNNIPVSEFIVEFQDAKPLSIPPKYDPNSKQ